MTDVLLVGAGGFIGAASRYGVLMGVSRLLGQPTFPWGVLVANVVGSLIIGALMGLAETRQLFSAEVRLFLFVGILGGFTTFSAVSNDTLVLLRNAAYLQAAANVLLTVTLGLAAVAIGYATARRGVASAQPQQTLQRGPPHSGGLSGVRGSGKTFKTVSFSLIPLVDAGGFTLIPAFSPQGRGGLHAFAGMTGGGG